MIMSDYKYPKIDHNSNKVFCDREIMSHMHCIFIKFVCILLHIIASFYLLMQGRIDGTIKPQFIKRFKKFKGIFRACDLLSL